MCIEVSIGESRVRRNDVYLENGTIKDKSLLDSAAVADLDTSSDGYIRTDLCIGVDIGSFVDEAGLYDGRAGTLTVCSGFGRNRRRALAEEHRVGSLVRAQYESIGRDGGAVQDR